MPYLLNAPASMAMNSGPCSSDTAGTATLIILSGVSAGNVVVADARKTTVREKKLIQHFISCSCCFSFMPRLLQEQANVQPGVQDRKSTRLNSSHSQISYAVFCLKKK